MHLEAQSASQPVPRFPAGEVALCCHMEPCNVSGSLHIHTCLHLCPFHWGTSSAQTDKTQQHLQCHRVPGHQRQAQLPAGSFNTISHLCIPSMSFSLHCLKQRVLPLPGISPTDPSLRAGEAWPSCILPAHCATSIHPLLPPSTPEAEGWMCGFMAGHSTKSFHTHLSITLHHWTDWGSSGKVSLPAEFSKGSTPECPQPEQGSAPDVPQLCATCRIPEQWHSLGSGCWCGSGPCGGITPRGAQQAHLESYKPCPVPEPKHKMSHVTIQVRFRKGRAFLCC